QFPVCIITALRIANYIRTHGAIGKAEFGSPLRDCVRETRGNRKDTVRLPAADHVSQCVLHPGAGQFIDEVPDKALCLVKTEEPTGAAPVARILEGSALLATTLAIAVRLAIGVGHAERQALCRTFVRLDLKRMIEGFSERINVANAPSTLDPELRAVRIIEF